jgi:hypothetical protein
MFCNPLKSQNPFLTGIVRNFNILILFSLAGGSGIYGEKFGQVPPILDKTGSFKKVQATITSI